MRVHTRPHTLRVRQRPGARVLAALVVGLAPFFPARAGAQNADDVFAERRARLFRELDGAPVLVVGGAGRAGRDVAYLTGYDAGEAVLLVHGDGDEIRAGLFIAEHAVAAPYAPRVAAAGAATLQVHPLAALERGIAEAVADSDRVHLVGLLPQEESAAGSVDAALAARADLDVVRGEATTALYQMRAVKTEDELARIRRAAEITVAAHRAIMRELRPGLTERQVKDVVTRTFRSEGADATPAFEPIVASGPNATEPHYRGSSRGLEAGDLVKVDIGAMYGGYAADVTRTYPVGGAFSAEQRAIYQLVRDAQAAAESVARPGATRAEMTRAAEEVLARGLTDLGLIEAPDATYDCPGPSGRPCRQLDLYFVHALGHGLGLDVHDPWPATLVEGTAFVIEPGIYVAPNLLDRIPDSPRNRALVERIRPALERYRGIGVRIEDSYLVTGGAVEWISPLPRELDEIERILADGRLAP